MKQQRAAAEVLERTEHEKEMQHLKDQLHEEHKVSFILICLFRLFYNLILILSLIYRNLQAVEIEFSSKRTVSVDLTSAYTSDNR